MGEREEYYDRRAAEYDESIAAVKERWQLTVTRQGQPPPPPLKACPAHLRATA